MPIFLERYVLPVLAAATIALIMTNPLSLDWSQRISVFVAVIALAYFASHTVHKRNDKRGETPRSDSRAASPSTPERSIPSTSVARPQEDSALRGMPASVDALAAAVAARLPAPTEPPSHGPYPPYTLGGSLDPNDLFDGYIGTRGLWHDVKNSQEATVDWTDMKRAPLVVSLVVLGGRCTVELLDENGLTVGKSGMVGVRPDGKGPLARTSIQLPFNRGTGIKKYRLRMKRDDGEGGVDTFAVSGEIVFPSASLGGDPNDWSAANTKPSEWRPVKDFRDAAVNWDDVHDPINVVYAEGTMFLSNPIHGAEGGPLGRGRIRILDVTEHAKEIALSDWGNVGRRSGMGRGPGGIPTPFRLQVPKGTGRRLYRLEVQAEDAALGATATGRIVFGH
jgi:hypothetical protein